MDESYSPLTAGWAIIDNERGLQFPQIPVKRIVIGALGVCVLDSALGMKANSNKVAQGFANMVVAMSAPTSGATTIAVVESNYLVSFSPQHAVPKLIDFDVHYQATRKPLGAGKEIL